MTAFPLPATAEDILLSLVEPISATETVRLAQAQGRITAIAVTATIDFPYWDNSAMDGYAVRYQDVIPPSLEESVCEPLTLVGEIPAGTTPTMTLQPGEAVRIFTGAMIPEGADTVVIQEVCRQEDNHVWVERSPQALGEYIRYRGDYCQEGEVLLPAGAPILEADMAILATMQISRVEVLRRPRVAIFSSGNELIHPDQPLQPGQIIDSNHFALLGFLQTLGVEVLPLGIVKDDRDALKTTIQGAVTWADLVLSTGGVSVGDYDYIADLMINLGGEMALTRVAMKPGKPLKAAKFPNGTVYVGIPGNPVSALVTCWRLIHPLLQKLAGLSNSRSTWMWANLKADIKGTVQRETYIWGRLEFGEPISFMPATGQHSSANLISLAQANALAVIPQKVAHLCQGESVEVLLRPTHLG